MAAHAEGAGHGSGKHGHHKHDVHPEWGVMDPKNPPRISQEEIEKHRVPIGYRDICAPFYILYRECADKEGLMAKRRCKHSHHKLEECFWHEYRRRVLRQHAWVLEEKRIQRALAEQKRIAEAEGKQ